VTAAHVRFWLIGLAVTALLLWLLSGILMPFVAGMIIAYVLDPVADRFEAIGMPRWLATTMVLLLFVIIIATVLLVLVPVIASQVDGLIRALPGYLEQLTKTLTPVMEQLRTEMPTENFQRLKTALGEQAGQAVSWLGAVIGGIWRGGLAILDIISLLVITPVVAFYLLRDWDRMTATIDQYLPRPYAPTIHALVGEIDSTLANFLRGQGLVCLILGAFYAISLTVVGLNFGLLVGLGAGLISFIPYVGSIIGFLVSTGIALVQFDNWVMWLVVAGIFVFGQAVEGNFLTPKLVGGSVGLHPVWVIFALLAGGSLLGFTGVMLAVPVAAAIGVLVRFSLRQYRQSRYFHGEPEMEEVEAEEQAALARKVEAKR
jgi:predicted PurR-regulated permease PerM